MWTHFMDMYSGGGTKEPPYEHIYIEAPESEAKIIFYNRFGHNPERVSCTCCGEDYSISEESSLEQATGYERGCAYGYYRPDGTECPEKEAWKSGKGLKKGYSNGYIERPDEERSYRPYLPLDEYKQKLDVLIIHATEIANTEREGDVPSQGFMWVG